VPNQLDDKTLAVLMVIAELVKEKHDPKHINTLYERALTQIASKGRS
jgi:hypothetical protein